MVTQQADTKRVAADFKGRRIELSRDFDAMQLRRAIEVLEGF
jgi:hypothetical protein